MADCSADVVGIDGNGRHEEDDGSVDLGVGEDQWKRGRVIRSGRGAEHVDRIGDRSLGGQCDGEGVGRRLDKPRQLEPYRLARVGTKDAKPTGVRQDGDAPTGGNGLAREQRRDVEQAA